MTKRLVVVGAGVMGRQVALWAAGCGYQVVLVDPSDAAIQKAQTFFEEKRNTFPVLTEHPHMLSRISTHVGLVTDSDVTQAIAEAHVVWEFVPEQIDLKQQTLRSIATVLGPKAILVSGTSALRARDIFTGNLASTRCVKLHPFALLPLTLPMLEVVEGPQTSATTLEAALNLAFDLRLVPFVIQNDPVGQGMNRIWELIKEDTLLGIAKGRYSPEEIDTMFRIFTGMFAGPARLMDMVGLGTVSSIMEYYQKNQAGVQTADYDEIIDLARSDEKLHQQKDAWRSGCFVVKTKDTVRQVPFLTANQLAGEWRLKSMSAIGLDDRLLYYPFGERASGRLCYTRFGSMFVTLQKEANEQLSGQVPSALRALADTGIIYYRGKFWTDVGNRIIHQTEEAFPIAFAQQTLTRFWSFDQENNLVLDTPAGQYGEPETRIRLIWEYACCH